MHSSCVPATAWRLRRIASHKHAAMSAVFPPLDRSTSGERPFKWSLKRSTSWTIADICSAKEKIRGSTFSMERATQQLGVVVVSLSILSPSSNISGEMWLAGGDFGQGVGGRRLSFASFLQRFTSSSFISLRFPASR